ncbi:RNA binding S1 domain protein [Galdieria sulphuraria]|uniref:RNA binding S1 domain protein n=1 Tax=Galdieria sulphuraria TaxID=130081 RepID=M2W3T4_GALSU|nr:RNA binding S1 domain protein [Galdieria sulphuraria]EME30376.1 RNA binding S1 domain protein [Galdieria sulphuraria]|eukprot:XP_005706896.1 RNA binding S1 domain protein [Galdieria sulphuraria]
MRRSSPKNRPVAFQNVPLLSAQGIFVAASRLAICQSCPGWKGHRRYTFQWVTTSPFLSSNCYVRRTRVERYGKFETLASLEEERKTEEGVSNLEQSHAIENTAETPLQPISVTEEAAETEESSPKKSQVNKGRKSETGSRFRVLFDEIEVGQEYVGKVRKVTNYGAFVDIGCFTDGLLHVSQMSDTFVNDPTDIVKVGDEVKVRVVNKKPERKEFSLSIRPPRVVKKREEQQVATPMKEMDSKNNTDDNEYAKVRGRSSVSRLQRMGISMDVESADDSSNPTARVASNVRKSRMSSTKGSSSMKASFRKLARETDEQKFIKGTVVSVTEFGAFVDFGGPSDGLIHISEVTEDWLEKDDSGSRKIKVSVGDEVQVRVINVDVNRSRVSLSMKPFAMSAKKQLQEDLAAANENQPEFESMLALALRKALQEKEAELATQSRH